MHSSISNFPSLIYHTNLEMRADLPVPSSPSTNITMGSCAVDTDTLLPLAADAMTGWLVCVCVTVGVRVSVIHRCIKP